MIDYLKSLMLGCLVLSGLAGTSLFIGYIGTHWPKITLSIVFVPLLILLAGLVGHALRDKL